MPLKLVLRSRRAVSPIIAELLLIAMTVGAGVITYSYVTRLSGTMTRSHGMQVTEQVSMVAYDFQSTTTLTVYLQNTGSSSVTVSGVFYNGISMTPAVTPTGTSCADAFPSVCEAGQTLVLSLTLNPAGVAGTSQSVKTVTADGWPFPCTVVVGSYGQRTGRLENA